MNSVIFESTSKLVCKARSGSLCEHCLTTLVISSNPIVRFSTDLKHVVLNLGDATISEMKILLQKFLEIQRKFAARKFKNHVHASNQQICERCIGTLASSGFSSLDEIREWILCGFRAIGLACELIAIFLVGIFMIVMTFCPNVFNNARNEDENDEQKRTRAQKDAEHARSILDDLHAKNKQIKQRMTDKEALLKDDQQVAELHDAVHQVMEQGADPEELQRIANELLKSRLDENRKDERRSHLWSKLRGKEFAAARVFADADAKKREGKILQAEELYEKAENMMRDVNALYLEYKSV